MNQPWNNHRYWDNSDGLWNFLPECHRPNAPDNWDGKLGSESNWRPVRDDWFFLKQVPRTWTSFIFVSAEILEGDPMHWVNIETGEQHQGHEPYPNTTDYMGIERPGQELWIPKPWGKRGTHQKTRIRYVDPVTMEMKDGIYTSRVTSFGLGWRNGPRISDDYPDGKLLVYVNMVPAPYEFLTIQLKRIKE